MDASSDPLAIGIIGAGHLGQQLGTDFEHDPRATVTALAEVDDATRTSAGETLAVAADSRFADYETMLAAASLDAVVITTPHTLHYRQIRDAFDQGLDVLCEKPLTTDLDHARDLARRAQSGDSLLMVGYQRHLRPAFTRARQRWADGNATPQFITAEITQNWADRFESAWRTDPDRSGGGFLYDTGSHLLDALLWTTGLTPRTVTADMDFLDAADEVDTRARITIDFEEDTTATVSTYGDAPAVREHLHGWDDDGGLYIEGRHWDPRSLTVIDEDNTEVSPHLDHRNRQTKAAAFLDAVVERTTPPATAADALAVTAVTEAAYEAARTGDRVDVDLDR